MSKPVDRVGAIKRRISKKVLWTLISPLYIDYQPDYKRTVFLSGTEKSGTTWLSDIINYKNEYRYVFEPFWPLKVPICHGFHAQQYLRPENDDPYFVETATQILSGKIRNSWTDKYHRRFMANQRLIKDVRTNLFLKWLHVHFPDMPNILMLRHPCAVARSQLRRTEWKPSLKDEFLAQDTLVDDFLHPFVKHIEQAKPGFETFVFRWCIQNYVPLKQFKPGEIHLIFYEDLCNEPKAEIDRLFKYMGRDYDETVYQNIRKPSPVSREESAIMSGGSLIDGWRKQITSDQIAQAVDILGLFGLDYIYNAESVPQVRPDEIMITA
ncbi:MAG: sulfotransferase [Chloroflexota bacterium]